MIHYVAFWSGKGSDGERKRVTCNSMFGDNEVETEALGQ